MSIFFNNSSINDWNYGDDNIKKVYHHNSVCYLRISGGDSYNLFGKTTSSSPFTIRLNNVNETVTIVKNNGDGTYDWGLKYTNPITATTNMCNGNTKLLSFDWGDADISNLTSISYDSFWECSSLTSVTIPNSVTSIGVGAFGRCSGLTSITIPDSVTSISQQAFYNCTSLTSIDIPDSVTSIGFATFQGCSGLTSVTIPSGVTIIYSNTFYSCGSLTSIEIPNGVTSIGGSAFNSCYRLLSITIPNSVTSIDYSAFQNCSGLTSVTVNATTPPTLVSSDVFDNTNNCPIYVPAASVNAYKAASIWSTYASRIQAIPT